MMIKELFGALRLCAHYSEFSRQIDSLNKNVERNNGKGAYSDMKKCSVTVNKIVKAIR